MQYAPTLIVTFLLIISIKRYFLVILQYLLQHFCRFSFPPTQACRVIDTFIVGLARETAANKNVELGGRDGFKKFHHGVTNWICKVRRINGGWHISIARQLHVFFSTTPLLTPALQLQISETYCLLFRTHSALRNPLKKDALNVYQGTINDLLDRMVILCAPHTPSLCNSIKYHWPRHWGDIRIQLGCSAAEKSLERKLGEAQKRNFKFTNGKNNIEVIYLPFCCMRSPSPRPREVQTLP